MCLLKADRRRLDGFQCRCLRQILGIPPAFISRISNRVVYNRVECRPFSELLCQRQLLMFGKVMRSHPENPLRTASLNGNTLRPATDQHVRRVGRRRAERIPSVLLEAVRLAGGSHNLDEYTADPWHWKRIVCGWCMNWRLTGTQILLSTVRELDACWPHAGH